MDSTGLPAGPVSGLGAGFANPDKNEQPDKKQVRIKKAVINFTGIALRM